MDRRMNRRKLLKALAGGAVLIPFSRGAWALTALAQAQAPRKRLVVVMLRGAVLRSPRSSISLSGASP